MHVHIPQPCSENWNQMTLSGAGRHCLKCAETVVDFTGMSPETIAIYLELHSGVNVCGRFTKDQLAQDIPTPEEYVLHVVRTPWSFVRQVAALIIFALFLGASPTIAQTKQAEKARKLPKTYRGAPVSEPQVAGRTHPKTPGDTTGNWSRVMGRIELPPKKPLKAAPTKKPAAPVLNKPVSIQQQPDLSGRHLTGMVMISPPQKQ